MSNKTLAILFTTLLLGALSFPMARDFYYTKKAEKVWNSMPEESFVKSMYKFGCAMAVQFNLDSDKEYAAKAEKVVCALDKQPSGCKPSEQSLNTWFMSEIDSCGVSMIKEQLMHPQPRTHQSN